MRGDARRSERSLKRALTENEYFDRLITRLCDDRGPASLTSMLLRTNSAQGRPLLAYGATGGLLDFDRLSELALSATGPPSVERGKPGIPAAFDRAWLLQAARWAALRKGAGADDRALAVALFELVRCAHGLTAFDQYSSILYAQLLVSLGRLRRLRAMMPEVDIPEKYRWSIEVDALNPSTADGDADAWLDLLNATFTTRGLEPVSLSRTAREPFDRLASEASSHVDADEMVTVVLPTFRPDQSIFTAVNSVLAQTWQNLELLIVDDASPREHRGTLMAVAEMDERIRIVTAPANRGTYVARNLGLSRAQGEYVTFQDSDDWSHPRRLEHQVEAIRSADRILATRTWTMRAFPDLTFTFVGYSPDRINASSLLFRRRSVLDLIGYFDTVRKSADSEFAERIEAVSPGSLLDIAEPAPLAIKQLRHGSLTQGDLLPAWWHWARHAYNDAFRLWHRQIRSGRAHPHLDGSVGVRPVPLPESSWSPDRTLTETIPRYDVVLLNDWRGPRALSQRHAIDEVHLIVEHGMRVAVAHAESPFPLSERREGMSSAIQELINAGAVDLIHLTQTVRTDLVIACDPATLQFLPDITPALMTDRVAILAQLPEEGVDLGYRVLDCSANAERLFSCRARWVPRDARTRTFLSAQLEEDSLADRDLPASFDPGRLAAPTHRPSPRRPIVGRHGPDHWSTWPATISDLVAAYPDDDAFDVRLLGGHRTPMKLLGGDVLPPNWLSFGDDELTVRQFLAQLDFFVYLNHPEAPIMASRPPLEAMASGCVVILPPSLQGEYGDGAVYCTPQEVQRVIRNLYRSPADYAAHQQRGRARVVDRHNSQVFYEQLERLLSY